MKRGNGGLPAAVACAAVAAAAWAQTTDVQLGLRENDTTTTAFTHARVAVTPGRVVDDATLVVRDGLVVSVRAGAAAPTGARVIDLGDRTVYPGFIDPYTDYGLATVGDLNPPAEGPAPRYAGSRSGLNAWNDTVHAERRWVDSFVPDQDAADALLARGVTAVQSSKLDGIFRGLGFVTTLAQETGNRTVLAAGSRQFASFDRGSSSQQYPNSLMGSIALVRQTLMDAEWYPRALAAWERDRTQERPELNAALAALAANEDPLVFETEDVLSLLRAQRIADEVSVPMVHVGSGDEYRYLDEVARIERPLILPVTLPETPDVGSYESSLDLDLSELRRWERAPYNAAALAEAGVALAFTGRGLREEEDFLANVRTMVEDGLPEEAALAALTTVPARIAGVEHLVGTLEPGRRGDFVVADGDLFAAGTKLVSVWIGGRRAKEIEPLDPEDYGGTWALELAGSRYTLEITGDPDSPKGTLAGGGEEIELEGVEATGGRLSFRATLSEGLARITLLRLGDTVRGEAAIGAADPVAVVLTPVAGTAAEEEGEGEEAEEAEVAAESAPVSRVTRPDVAFGFEELPEPEDVLVRNATVWTVDEQGTLENADLLVRGGKIAAVGQGLEAPAGVRVIDGTGKHVTPGMIDEHSHIAIQGGVNEGSNAVTAEVRIADVVLPTDVDIYRNLAGGTTIAQLLHGSANPIGGQAQVVKLRWGRGSEELKLDAAPATIKFALGENVKQSNWGDQNTIRYPQTRMGVETLIRDRFLAARDYAAAWDHWRDLSSSERSRTVSPRRDLQLEALAEVLHSERLVHCHSYVQSEVLMLMRLAEELGFRVQTFTHILEGYKVAPEMAAHGAGASTFSDWWAYKFEVYDAIPQNTCLLTEAGVVTSVNSDSPDLSRRLNTEAGKSVLYCGMPEEEAIRLATINPAKQLEIDDRVGSLTPGKDADFVIWNGNPLSTHTRAEQTWIDGTLYFSRERDEQLRRRDREERAALIKKATEKAGKEKEKAGEKGAEAGAGPEPSLHHRYDCDDREDYWNARTHS